MTTEAQVDILKSAAIREQVRQAGHNPDSKSGERLVEWANAQSEGARIPTVSELAAKAAEWDLPVEAPVHDPATVEQQIQEARDAGDFKKASLLQYQIDRRRAEAEEHQPTDEEVQEITDARERAAEAQREMADAETEDERRAARDRAQQAFAEASQLQLDAERRMKGNATPPEPHPTIQPTAGLTDAQRALLEDEDTPVKGRLVEAQEAGWHSVASILQTRLEREEASA